MNAEGTIATNMDTVRNSSSDVIIMVMGMTGAGKSTFISTLIGQDAGVGHTLQSCTQGVSMHSLMVNERRVYLIDTPGFNDTWRSDIDILREIAFFMGQTYRNGVNLAGIIYLHRITDNRVTGSCAKNFAMLEAFCGPEAASRTTLATSMWDSFAAESPDFQAALSRENELVNTPEFWGRMNDHGSQTRRWAGDRLSAQMIVDDILRIHDTTEVQPIRLHREYVDERRELSDTSAGRELLKEHEKLLDKQRMEIETLRQDWEQAEDRRARTVAEQLREQKLELKRQLKESEAAEAELKVTLRSLAQQKEKEYRLVLAALEAERQQIDADLEQREREYRRLEYDSAENDKVLHDTLQDLNRTELVRANRDRVKADLRRRRQEQEEIRSQWEQEQRLNDQKRQDLAVVIKLVKKRKVMKRNLIPLLGILAGSGVIAAGAATGLIPLVAAGVGVVGSAANNLNFSRKPTGHKKPKEWQVDDRD